MEQIQKNFLNSWTEISPKLEELKTAKETATDNEKKLRPSNATVHDQVRDKAITSLMKRKQILESQLNYQNKSLEEYLVPQIEIKRAEFRNNIEQRQKVLSEIEEDEADLKAVELKLKECSLPKNC